jgi:aspartyl-tRNA(Asn)/glutamyl-tRNA(Gln) amidotransferase subunit A
MKSARKNIPNSFQRLTTPAKRELKSFRYATLQHVAKLIQTQKVSPVEVVDACLKRIEDLNPKLNAFITILADQAHEQAQEAEAEIKAGRWRGPLHGIPIGIKDFYDTAGIKTTAGFEHFKDRVPVRDAVGVLKFKKAGAIMIGKTNMHQLGMGTTGLDSYFGSVHNPWDPEYIAGGSSSGSAAAVASGMCYATLDTDAIGSCRLPAACCGVVGFKGTYGLISAQGILEGEEADEMILWLSHAAITTRSVQDTAIVLDVLAERNKHINIASYFSALRRNRKLRVGVANNFKAEQEVKTAFEKAIETIRGFGYTMRSVAAPFGNPSGGIGNIEADRQTIADEGFKDIDVLLLPTTTTTVPKISDAGANPQALSPENTAFANYYRLPAISILCGFDANGLPLGLQIIGKPWDESTILRLGYEYEAATEYYKKYPY